MISSSITGRDSLLFVYGTLRPFVDIPMARWLRDRARYIGPARTRGRLYDLGPYPGMRVSRGRREWVAGDVYRVVNPRVLRVLDRYEAGSAVAKARFVRRRCTVRLAQRRTRAAWVYLYRYNVVRAARIPTGDYRSFATAPRAAAMNDGLMA